MILLLSFYVSFMYSPFAMWRNQTSIGIFSEKLLNPTLFSVTLFVETYIYWIAKIGVSVFALNYGRRLIYENGLL